MDNINVNVRGRRTSEAKRTEPKHTGRANEPVMNDVKGGTRRGLRKFERGIIELGRGAHVIYIAQVHCHGYKRCHICLCSSIDRILLAG